MIRFLFFTTILLSSSLSWGCSIPQSGPEFDALIFIERIKANKFRATFPQKAGNLNFGATIKASYYDQKNKLRHAEYWKVIHPKKEDLNYVASFDLKKIEGYIPYIEVYWYPEFGGLCGAIGESKDLVLK